MMAMALADEGFEVISAIDGLSGCEELLVHKSELRLLITDVYLPGPLDGRMLARIAASSGIKVLATSGANIGDHELPSGSKFLAKPFRCADLIETVAQHFAA
jgi:CheY-like chemotaxis protein